MPAPWVGRDWRQLQPPTDVQAVGTHGVWEGILNVWGATQGLPNLGTEIHIANNVPFQLEEARMETTRARLEAHWNEVNPRYKETAEEDKVGDEWDALEKDWYKSKREWEEFQEEYQSFLVRKKNRVGDFMAKQALLEKFAVDYAQFLNPDDAAAITSVSFMRGHETTNSPMSWSSITGGKWGSSVDAAAVPLDGFGVGSLVRDRAGAALADWPEQLYPQNHLLRWEEDWGISESGVSMVEESFPKKRVSITLYVSAARVDVRNKAALEEHLKYPGNRLDCIVAAPGSSERTELVVKVPGEEDGVIPALIALNESPVETAVVSRGEHHIYISRESGVLPLQRLLELVDLEGIDRSGDGRGVKVGTYENT